MGRKIRPTALPGDRWHPLDRPKIPLSELDYVQEGQPMGEMLRTVLAPCLLIVGDVASEDLPFAVSGLGKFIPKGGAKLIKLLIDTGIIQVL